MSESFALRSRVRSRKVIQMAQKLAAVSLLLVIVLFLLVMNATHSDVAALAQNTDAKAQRSPRQNQANQRKANASRTRMAPLTSVRNAPPNTNFIDNMIRAAREGGADVLSTGDSYDDFPSVAKTSDGTLYVSYAAYYDAHDQIRIHQRLENGQWSTRSYVPLAQPKSDIWMPQLAVDAKDRLWLIWCEQT